jgi:hypothetical protein
MKVDVSIITRCTLERWMKEMGEENEEGKGKGGGGERNGMRVEIEAGGEAMLTRDVREFRIDVVMMQSRCLASSVLKRCGN